MGYSATDIVIIITAIGTAVTSAIAAWKSTKVDNKMDASKEELGRVSNIADVNFSKLLTIDTSINGSLKKNKHECDMLQRLNQEFIAQLEPDVVDKIRKKVNKEMAEIGGRRSTDEA